MWWGKGRNEGVTCKGKGSFDITSIARGEKGILISRGRIRDLNVLSGAEYRTKFKFLRWRGGRGGRIGRFA